MLSARVLGERGLLLALCVHEPTEGASPARGESDDRPYLLSRVRRSAGESLIFASYPLIEGEPVLLCRLGVR